MTLLLLRHAKAVAQVAGEDFARELTPQGHADAGRLGIFLRDRALVPDQALVSPAARTRQTMKALAKTIGAPVATTYDPGLYDGTARQLRGRLERAAGSGILLMVGHNPGIMELALSLATSGDPRERDAMRSYFPPCSLVVLTFDRGGWREAADAGGNLDAFVTPEHFARR